jgi:prolactin regulatory element-binding protein
VTVLTYPELEVVEQDVVRNKGGSGGEVVDLDWSTDGAWVSLTIRRRSDYAKFCAQFAITTPKGIDLYSVSLPQSSEEKESSSTPPSLTFRQTILPPSLDINPVVFRSARFARTNPYVTPDDQPPVTLHCILNTLPLPKKRTAKRTPAVPEKAFACNLVLVRPKPSPAAVPEKGKVEEPLASGDVVQELGKWDVVARREVGNRPVTAMQIR